MDQQEKEDHLDIEDQPVHQAQGDHRDQKEVTETRDQPDHKDLKDIWVHQAQEDHQVTKDQRVCLEKMEKMGNKELLVNQEGKVQQGILVRMAMTANLETLEDPVHVDHLANKGQRVSQVIPETEANEVQRDQLVQQEETETLAHKGPQDLKDHVVIKEKEVTLDHGHQQEDQVHLDQKDQKDRMERLDLKDKLQLSLKKAANTDQ